VGDGPAMRRPGTAPFLAVRRTGGESLYVAVHHPYVGEPLIRKVERVGLDPSDDQAVAIRVTLPDRVDTIISTAGDPPWRTRRTADRRLEMRGRFAHLAEGRDAWAYLVDGDLLRTGDLHMRGNGSHQGTLTRTYRMEAGDSFDAFATPAFLHAPGSLAGRTLLVDLGGVLVQGFRLKGVRRRGAETILLSQDEPGMTISRGLVKMEYYPCWGIKGAARFRVPGSALLLRDAEGAWRLTASGRVSASVGGRPITASDDR